MERLSPQEQIDGIDPMIIENFLPLERRVFDIIKQVFDDEKQMPGTLKIVDLLEGKYSRKEVKRVRRAIREKTRVWVI